MYRSGYIVHIWKWLDLILSIWNAPFLFSIPRSNEFISENQSNFGQWRCRSENTFCYHLALITSSFYWIKPHFFYWIEMLPNWKILIVGTNIEKHTHFETGIAARKLILDLNLMWCRKFISSMTCFSAKRKTILDDFFFFSSVNQIGNLINEASQEISNSIHLGCWVLKRFSTSDWLISVN